jgi:GAF domain-containing protein
VQAETRAEIEHAVCDRLTEEDRFRFAWIGVTDPLSETVTPSAWAGDDRGYLDSRSIPVAEDGTEPAGRTAATRDVSLVSNVADQLRTEDWRKEALSRDYLSVMSVPLAYDDVTYGVLTVYASVQDAFDELTQAVMVELGETIASATSAITRKNALLSPSMTRVVYHADEPVFVLSRLAAAVGGTITYQGEVQTTSEGSFVFVAFEGATAEAIEQAAADSAAIETVSRISSHDGEGMVRLRLAQPFFALELADHGAILRSAVADTDGLTIVVDLPESVDVRHVAGLVSEAVGPVELRSKQALDQAESGPVHTRFFDDLTDRQLEVVQTAYYSGFFESPRESSGEDVAATLGISPQAFYQHTRTAERKLFATLFDHLGEGTLQAGTS